MIYDLISLYLTCMVVILLNVVHGTDPSPRWTAAAVSEQKFWSTCSDSSR